jgi:hypothetical protein
MTEVIRLHTLFDISESGTNKNYNARFLNLRDSQGVILSNSKLWEFSRNQQRNLDTVRQLLCLRQEVTYLSRPTLRSKQERHQHRFGKRFEFLDIWTIDFAYDNMDHDFMLRAIYDDFDGIPMITGLKETVTINPACSRTSGANRNVYFSKIQKP